ncbi:battenin CLN3 protein [Serendipita sp. 411]|nr:battenin CLN3 protein [Serendipita sp. 411]
MLAANHDLELRNIMTIRDSVHNNGRRNGQSVDIPTRTWRILGASFFLLGLVNNVLYVIILSAALDLVSSVPKGLVLFCNIAPSLAAKIGWPYLLKGQVRYTRRIIGCCTLSFTGMLVIATFDSLAARLLGICLASFSCGLGEITFLQLITRYNSLEINGHCVGYFASGTGAAGLFGAGLWWILRQIGVRTGILICSALPFAMPLVWFSLLPQPNSVFFTEDTTPQYSTLPTAEEELPESGEDDIRVEDVDPIAPLASSHSKVSLSLKEKWDLTQPMLLKYMLPLFSVYLFEYTINQGVSPTLLYTVPTSGLWSFLIKNLRDYYPLWQLIYQTFVFLSRSSISFGLPPLPVQYLPLPAILQGILLSIFTSEAALGLFDVTDGAYFVALLIAIEGICGGLAYVNVYYHIGHDHVVSPRDVVMDEEREELISDSTGNLSRSLEPSAGRQVIDSNIHADGTREEWVRQAREFRMGSMGFADSFGILLASLIAMPTELYLCSLQVRRGIEHCRQI